MRYPIAIFAALSIFGSGCTTTITNQFHGEVRNIKHDNYTETLLCEIPGYCSGPSASGGQFVGFSLPTREFSLFLFYPKIALGQRLVTNTVPPSVDAWLIRTNGCDWSEFIRSGALEKLRLLGAEQLVGRVMVKWRNNAHFSIIVDLAGNSGNPILLRGEFSGFTRTKFDPSVFWVGFYMLFFGEGHTTALQPVAVPAITTQPK